jgi:hypothetical protein
MLKTLKTIWKVLEIRKAFKDMCKEGNQEMKESWPILLGLTVVALLPFTISLICGWC